MVAAALTLAMATPTRAAELRGRLSIADLRTAADAVVWLEPLEASAEQPPGARRALIDQHGLDFDPRILVVTVGTVVEFHNSDTVLHNIFAPPLGGESFDLGTWPAGRSRTHRFDRQGVTTLLCNVHPEMQAYIVTVPTVHWDISDADGSFRLTGVPEGRYTLHVWHERAGRASREIDLGAELPSFVRVSLPADDGR